MFQDNVVGTDIAYKDTEKLLDEVSPIKNCRWKLAELSNVDH